MIMTQFKQDRRAKIAELRPVTYEETRMGQDRFLSETAISVSDKDIKNGSPKPGDMIARNPKSHDDQWLVSKEYFEDNFEELT